MSTPDKRRDTPLLSVVFLPQVSLTTPVPQVPALRVAVASLFASTGEPDQQVQRATLTDARSPLPTTMDSESSMEDSVSESIMQKFGHLLKPLRNLADDWEIDIAKDLEEYLEELGNLQVWMLAAAAHRALLELCLLAQTRP